MELSLSAWNSGQRPDAVRAFPEKFRLFRNRPHPSFQYASGRPEHCGPQGAVAQTAPLPSLPSIRGMVQSPALHAVRAQRNIHGNTNLLLPVPFLIVCGVSLSCKKFRPRVNAMKNCIAPQDITPYADCKSALFNIPDFAAELHPASLCTSATGSGSAAKSPVPHPGSN